MSSNARTDLVDVVTPCRRGHRVYQRILNEAALDPGRWMRHHFIVVFDSDESDEELALKAWLERARETLVLPRITATTAPAGDANILRQIGFALGDNPFVYFQDDDDPLPRGLDQRIEMMAGYQVDAVFGATQTVTGKGAVVEQFPVMQNGETKQDVMAGQRWFPSYGHPLAALFRRSTLDRVPVDDGRFYHGGDGKAFNVRFCNAGVIMAFLPDVCRQVRLHSDNDRGILELIAATELAADIRRWRDYVSCERIRTFQEEIAEALERRWITTFREIAAMVDIALGR